MPDLFNGEGMSLAAEGQGWQELTLADDASFGQPAMVARRLSMQPGAVGPRRTHGPFDQVLYVIQGGGQVEVDGQVFTLDHESVIWLEPGENYQFTAGSAGLEILQGFAPKEETPHG